MSIKINSDLENDIQFRVLEKVTIVVSLSYQTDTMDRE